MGDGWFKGYTQCQHQRCDNNFFHVSVSFLFNFQWICSFVCLFVCLFDWFFLFFSKHTWDTKKKRHRQTQTHTTHRPASTNTHTHTYKTYLEYTNNCNINSWIFKISWFCFHVNWLYVFFTYCWHIDLNIHRQNNAIWISTNL